MDIAINEAGEEDARTVSELARKTWSEAYSELIPKEQTEYMLEKFQSAETITKRIADGEKYYTVLSNGRKAGYFCIVYEKDGMFLSKIYVLAEFQRMGIATRILEFVKSACISAGCHRIYLTVNRGNKNAIAFYRYAGFTVIENTVKDIGSGFVMDDYVMELPV